MHKGNVAWNLLCLDVGRNLHKIIRPAAPNKEKCVTFIGMKRKQRVLGRKIPVKSVVKVLWQSNASAGKVLDVSEVNSPQMFPRSAKFLLLSYLLSFFLIFIFLKKETKIKENITTQVRTT